MRCTNHTTKLTHSKLGNDELLFVDNVYLHISDVENCRAVCLMENNDCKKNKMNVNLSIVESTPPNN
ncbi:hypothetical protein KSF78_0009006 [Schistosoma japonicum]|nr:hypothetical protein KSF78_0009006 [Schistosoma japonicum]